MTRGGSAAGPSGGASAPSEPVVSSVSVGPVPRLAYAALQDERDRLLAQSEELIAAYAALEGELEQARVALDKVRRVLLEAGIVRLGDTEDDDS